MFGNVHTGSDSGSGSGCGFGSTSGFGSGPKWYILERALREWSASQVCRWLANDMQMPGVGAAAEAEDVDGATAAEMGKADWVELGASGIQAAKIVGALKKMG